MSTLLGRKGVLKSWTVSGVVGLWRNQKTIERIELVSFPQNCNNTNCYISAFPVLLLRPWFDHTNVRSLSGRQARSWLVTPKQKQKRNNATFVLFRCCSTIETLKFTLGRIIFCVLAVSLNIHGYRIASALRFWLQGIGNQLQSKHFASAFAVFLVLIKQIRWFVLFYWLWLVFFACFLT